MSFGQSENSVPTSIGEIQIVLIDFPNDEDRARFAIQVLDQNEEIMDRKIGNLISHITAQQIAQIQNFMADIRTQAETEILP